MPRTKFLIAGGLIVAAITLLMWSGVNSSMVYYYSVSELHSRATDFTTKEFGSAAK